MRISAPLIALALAAWIGPGAALRALGAPSSPPRYFPMAPFELALAADLVVVGTVGECGAPRHEFDPPFTQPAATFVLRVEEVVAGDVEPGDLVVRQFQDWTCASRYTRYREGQRALFHLAYDRTPEGEIDASEPPRPMGGGNEGECPLKGDDVLVEGYGWPNHEWEVHLLGKNGNYGFRGIAVPRSEYVEAVRGLRRAFRWLRDPDCPYRLTRGMIAQQVEDDELELFRSSSTTAGRMVAATQERARRYRLR